MRKSTYSWTEDQVTASQKRANQEVSDKERAWKEKAKRMAHLGAIRLAKEHPDRKAIETVGVEATPDRKVFSKNSKSKPLLQVHGH
jgi:hypothetical protein